jgi:excisionase family DNA binding protein
MRNPIGADLAHSSAARQAADVPFSVQHFADLPDDAGLTIKEAALVLNVGISTVWSWIASGRIGQPRRIGRTTRLTAGTLRDVMGQQ